MSTSFHWDWPYCISACESVPCNIELQGNNRSITPLETKYITFGKFFYSGFKVKYSMYYSRWLNHIQDEKKKLYSFKYVIYCLQNSNQITKCGTDFSNFNKQFMNCNERNSRKQWKCCGAHITQRNVHKYTHGRTEAALWWFHRLPM